MSKVTSRDQQILRAAEDLFYEKGFAAVGVDEIAARAGISGSGVYRYFSSKDEILGLLFDRAADLLLVTLGKPAADPQQELRSLVAAHVEFAFTHRKLAAIWSYDERALTGTHRRSFRQRQRRYTDRWIENLDACYPGHSTEELTTVIRATWALLMSDGSRPSDSPRPDSAAELLATLALHAITALSDTVTDSPSPLDRHDY